MKKYFVLLLIYSPLILFSNELISINGLDFEYPSNLIKIDNTDKSVQMYFQNKEQTLSVIILNIDKTRVDPQTAANELINWPSNAETFINSFGKSNSSILESSLKVNCSYKGVPHLLDPLKTAYSVKIETLCENTSDSYLFNSRVIIVYNSLGSTLIRIDSVSASDLEAENIFTKIWSSIKIHEKYQLDTPETSNQSIINNPISGGQKFQIRNYFSVNMSTLIGEFIGTILSCVLFGYLLTILFTKMGIPMKNSIILGQIILIVLRTTIASQNGDIIFDPIMNFSGALIAYYYLINRARKLKPQV